jgi:general secretion pathway protein G
MNVKCCRTRDCSTRSGAGAFTLIELLCVMVIVAILTAMVLGAGAFAKAIAYRKRAQAQLQQIDSAIVEYKIKNGSIPKNGGLTIITNYLPMGFLYSNNLPLDPWSEPYQYTNNGDAYILLSKGPDMATGDSTNSADDIELRK